LRIAAPVGWTPDGKKRRTEGLRGGALKAAWLGCSARVAVPSETLGGIRRTPLIRYSR
jgi:hypothetical protein